MKRSYVVIILGSALALALSVAAWAAASVFRQLGTSYAPGYSEHAFQAVAAGDLEQEVLAKLGPPLWEVGYLFYYYYQGRNLVFLVDTEVGTASLADFSRAAENVLADYANIATLGQLTEALGPPERFIGVESSQSRNPEEKTLVYSQQDQEFHLPWWQLRIVYVHKDTGTVTRKSSRLMVD